MGRDRLDELTEEEAAELMTLLRKIRQAQREVLQMNMFIIFTTKTQRITFIYGWYRAMHGCMNLDVRLSRFVLFCCMRGRR
jgi:hypothetical protein